MTDTQKEEITITPPVEDKVAPEPQKEVNKEEIKFEPQPSSAQDTPLPNKKEESEKRMDAVGELLDRVRKLESVIDEILMESAKGECEKHKHCNRCGMPHTDLSNRDGICPTCRGD